MADPATLSVLQERLRSATGPDRELDASIYVALERGEDPADYRLNRQYADFVPEFTGSVDAAIGLVTKHLPGAYGHVAFGNIPEARLYYNHSEEPISSFGATPALALAAALAAALARAPT